MNYELAERLLGQLERTDLTGLRDALFSAAIGYAEKRSRWYLARVQESAELEQARHFSHNVLVDAINILSRNQLRAGEDARWRLELPSDRGSIGDFACYVQCILALRAR